ncbi:MAG: inositol monophosphatase family protein [Verrucomicrobiales bacterium]|nr:inositol monophosphatase [Verrucomicrobiales bacterium]
MTESSPESPLAVATAAAREAGALLREHYESDLHINEATAHDIKLEMDVRSQDLISSRLLAAFPGHSLLGEEGDSGDATSDHEWIVDPIDGTVNYFYGIPHFCVSIALRIRGELAVGVIYDPMMDELFTAEAGGPALKNGRPIQVSGRSELREAMITIGFSKTKESLEAGLARFSQVADKVKKTRMLGSAALAMCYVACGRLDAYIEEQISLWDVAAGLLIVERAGGRTILTPHSHEREKYSISVWNGRIPVEGI